MRRAVRSTWFFILLVFSGKLLMSLPQDDVLKRLSALIPESALGWTAGAIDELYDPKTIFNYLDGAGEVYIAYNFKYLLSRRFEKNGQPDIIADLFDMGTSADAFGVFTHDLDGEDPGIGQGGTYQGGLLSFWRDRYFVSLFAEKETGEAKAALTALGKEIASRIGRDGAKPALLRLLPGEFAEAKAVHYLHSPVILNYHFFVSRDNILKLGPETDVLLSKPAARGRGEVLLIVKYSKGADAAAEAYRSFIAGAMPAAQGSGLAQAADGRWTAAEARGDLLLVIFGAPTAERARAVLANVR